MFDGKVGGSRAVSSANRRDTKATTKDLVEKAKKEREQRAVQRQRNDSAKKIQSLSRKYLVQQKQFNYLRSEFDKKLTEIQSFKALLKSRGANFVPPAQVLTQLLRSLSFFFRIYADQLRVLSIQLLVLDSFSSSDKLYNMSADDDPVNHSRNIFLLLRTVKLSLLLLVKNLAEQDTSSAASHIDFIQKFYHFSQSDLVMNDGLFSLFCEALNYLHSFYIANSVSKQLAELIFSSIGGMIMNMFESSNDSLLPKRIHLVRDYLLVLPDLDRNPVLSKVLRSFSLMNRLQQDNANFLGLFLNDVDRKASREHRFYGIANFSHIFLGNQSSVAHSSIMDGIRIPWLLSVNSLLQDESSDKEDSVKKMSNDSNVFLKTFSSGVTDRPIHQGVPLVLYLCRNTPGFPLLLLEGEGKASVTANSASITRSTAMDEDAALEASAWQQQEQEIVSEYIIGDGNRKLEIRISMILNEIARRENKLFVNQRSNMVMEPIESILRVLTNRDVAASLFEILPDASLPLPTRLAVITVYAKVLISFPYKVLENTYKGSQANTPAMSTTRDSLLATLAFGRLQQKHVPPSASKTNKTMPIAILLWQFLLDNFSAVIPTFLMTERRTTLVDTNFQQLASEQCGVSPETLYDTLVSLIYLFAVIFTHQLAATDDQELFAGDMIATETLIDMVRFLRRWFHKIFWLEPTCDFLSSFLHPLEKTISYQSVLQYSCLMASTKLFNQLCIRHERRAFLLDSDYQWPPFPSPEFALVDAETSERYYQVDRDNNILLNTGNMQKEGDFFVKNPNLQMVLTYIPQVIPFTQRVSLFQALVDRDKEEYFSALSGRMNMEEMIAGGQIVRITVRRDHMLEDAMKGLHSLHLRLKGRVQVEFISEQGFQEAGIDGGGLFKEFMDDFAQLISDPSVGLFVTTSEHLLTPNPVSEYVIGKQSANLQRSLPSTAASSAASHHHHDVMDVDLPTNQANTTTSSNHEHHSNNGGSNNSRVRAGVLSNRSHLEVFEFAGKMLGKALYEKILYQSELAPGFLNVLLGRSNSLDDLYHLDSAMYRSLMNLKRFALQEKGNVEDLDLYFDTESIVNGQRITEEIIANGSQTKVTNANLLIYIHRLAHFKQNVKIRDQSRAFLKGFREMIPLDWIRMFNTHELQLLISGDQRRIDLADMQRNVVYGSGYHPSQPYIQAFWEIVANMSAEDQALLLKFVTSSPRQPLLGFQALNPKFSIQQVSAYASVSLGSSQIPTNEEPRLPTAATCMNLLKLPLYPSVEILREKLLYAIRSHSGFELS